MFREKNFHMERGSSGSGPALGGWARGSEGRSGDGKQRSVPVSYPWGVDLVEAGSEPKDI